MFFSTSLVANVCRNVWAQTRTRRSVIPSFQPRYRITVLNVLPISVRMEPSGPGKSRAAGPSRRARRSRIMGAIFSVIYATRLAPLFGASFTPGPLTRMVAAARSTSSPRSANTSPMRSPVYRERRHMSWASILPSVRAMSKNAASSSGGEYPHALVIHARKFHALDRVVRPEPFTDGKVQNRSAQRQAADDSCGSHTLGLAGSAHGLHVLAGDLVYGYMPEHGDQVEIQAGLIVPPAFFGGFTVFVNKRLPHLGKGGFPSAFWPRRGFGVGVSASRISWRDRWPEPVRMLARMSDRML